MTTEREPTLTPELSRQIAAYFETAPYLALSITDALRIRREAQRARSYDELPEQVKAYLRGR